MQHSLILYVGGYSCAAHFIFMCGRSYLVQRSLFSCVRLPTCAMLFFRVWELSIVQRSLFLCMGVILLYIALYFHA